MAPNRRPPTMTCASSIDLLLPTLHRPIELGGRRLVRPYQLIGLVLELDEVGGGEGVLTGLVELHAVVAHHQLLGLEIGLGERVADLLGLRSEERRVGQECRSRWSPYH